MAAVQRYRRPSDWPPMIVTAIAARTVPPMVDSLYLREAAKKIMRGLAGQLARGFATGGIGPQPHPSFIEVRRGAALGDRHGQMAGAGEDRKR